jgi:hypothetical protein
MFTLILVLTAMYFLLTVIWESKDANIVIKVGLGMLTAMGAVLIAAHECITINNFQMAGLYNRQLLLGYFAMTTINLLWFAIIWTRKNWLNLGIKTGFFFLAFSTIFQMAVITKIVTIG